MDANKLDKVAAWIGVDAEEWRLSKARDQQLRRIKGQRVPGGYTGVLVTLALFSGLVGVFAADADSLAPSMVFLAWAVLFALFAQMSQAGRRHLDLLIHLDNCMQGGPKCATETDEESPS